MKKNLVNYVRRNPFLNAAILSPPTLRQIPAGQNKASFKFYNSNSSNTHPLKLGLNDLLKQLQKVKVEES